MEYLNKAKSWVVPVVLHADAENSRLSSYLIAWRPIVSDPPGKSNILAQASKIPVVAVLSLLAYCPNTRESCNVICVVSKPLVKVIPMRVRCVVKMPGSVVLYIGFPKPSSYSVRGRISPSIITFWAFIWVPMAIKASMSNLKLDFIPFNFVVFTNTKL